MSRRDPYRVARDLPGEIPLSESNLPSGGAWATRPHTRRILSERMVNLLLVAVVAH
jgi:hypothetical protein